MILLILGLLLWWATHLEKILAPGWRAARIARTPSPGSSATTPR